MMVLEDIAWLDSDRIRDAWYSAQWADPRRLVCGMFYHYLRLRALYM